MSAEETPAGAGGGRRRARRGYDRQGRGRSQWRRASPEMRPGSHHDGWAATPQAADQPHYVRRRGVSDWLLAVTIFLHSPGSPAHLRARDPELDPRFPEIASTAEPASTLIPQLGPG